MKLSRRIRRFWRYWFPHYGSPALRRLEIIGLGTNHVSAAQAQAVNCRIEFAGEGENTVEIEAGSEFVGVILVRGKDNRVVLGPNCTYRGRITVKGNGQRVVIGANTTAAGVSILAQEGCDVLIGANCMLSREIEIRTSDSHSVIDRETLRRLNTPGSVTIGNHVWIGLRAIISKGAAIPDDSIVGAGAFVNKQFEETGIVLAGSPAKIVRRNITWKRERKTRFRHADLMADKGH